MKNAPDNALKNDQRIIEPSFHQNKSILSNIGRHAPVKRIRQTGMLALETDQ